MRMEFIARVDCGSLIPWVERLPTESLRSAARTPFIFRRPSRCAATIG